ncbi:MAG: YhjD/YihY/BrkB family envelope integrity protein [Candidatus Hydrothermia bacterium]
MNKLILFLKRFWQKIQDDEIFGKASSLSYMTVFASVPAISLIFYLFARFSIFSDIYEKFKSFLFMYFIPQSGIAFEKKLDELLKNIGSLEIFGVIALIVTTVLVVDSIEGTINRIWGIEKKRPLFLRMASYWAFITLVPILIAFSLYISTRVASIGLFKAIGESLIFRSIQYILLPFLITVLAFFIIYYFLPNAEVNPLAALGGAIAGAFLWEISKWGFDAYVIYFSTIPKFYGTLGNILIFVFWIYLSWLFLLLGAEVAVFLEGDPGYTTPILLFTVLLLTYKKYEEGEPLSVKEVSKRLKVNMAKVRFAYRKLESKTLVVEIKKGFFVPVKHPEKAFLKDILYAIGIVNFDFNGNQNSEKEALNYIREKLDMNIKDITIKEVLPLVQKL